MLQARAVAAFELISSLNYHAVVGQEREACYTRKIVLQLMRNRIWPFGFMFCDWEIDNKALGSPLVA
ncbi:hypothetical protein [Rhodopseudomonas parapalustris]